VSESITITVPSAQPGGPTAVRGRIYNLNNTPLGNVKVTLRSSGHTEFSDGNGFFTIGGIPSGRQELIVNGRESNLGVFAILAVSVDLIEGVLNNLASPITLPDVDVESEVQISPTFTTVVTNTNLPGVELTILGGTARNSDGTPFTGKLSINPVPDYGRPESRPEELRPGMAVTIQPAGIRFNPPARLTFPNTDGMPPGNELNLWSLSPDSGTFSIVGKGVVSADGLSIITVEGGVSASAWHFPLASSPVPAGNQGNSFCRSCKTRVGSDADPEEGSLYITHSLPSYRSLGQSRRISLTYSSVTADPRPIISLDTTLSVRAAVPNTFSTRLLVGGVQQGGEVYTDARSLPENSDSSSLVSVQFDASNLSTGRYPYQATIFSNYMNSSIGGITDGNVIVLNRKTSPFGSGWAITDIQQLHPQSGSGVLLTSGDGTALFFSGGPDTFTAPAGDFSTLLKNPDNTFTRTLKDGTKIHFNAQGLQTSVIDRNGNTTSYAYDGSGRLTTITDPVGLATTLTYSGGTLQRITDPAGRQTLFQFDSAGNLSRITNPDNSFATYAYDGQGHITQATDEKGNSTSYAYDFAGRFSQSTRATGETRALLASKLQGLIDIAGGQGTPTNPAPVVQSQDATASLTDGKGNATRFTLDSLGQVTSQTDALGQTTTIERDANGSPTRITRPNGAVTTMTYDAKGNLLTSTDPVGATTTFTYEPNFNQIKTIRDPKGNTTTINYDATGNPIEIIDALGNRTQLTYDTRGLLTSVTSAVGTPVQNTTSFTYDSRGNLVTTTNPKGDVTTLAYDNAGNVFSSTDAENRVTEFTYDPRNRLVSVLDADLKITQYGYDPTGNLTQVRDAKNQITTFVYDELDRLVSATNPLGLTEIFAYDANGNLTSSTNRNGQTITFNYDALNRLTSKSRPPTSSEVGAQVTSFTYDSVGNLMSALNPVVNVINQYDLANRLVSSIATTETAVSGTTVQINTDTTIGGNNFQFEGRTLQVNGRALTVDGSHTFANLILVNGAVLTHNHATSSAIGKLDVTVTGTIQIDATSRIDVTGRGFLGGNRAGNPFGESGMTIGFQRGSTGRSGASYGGLGGNFEGSSNPIYGDFRNPNQPGSGGAERFNQVGNNGGGLVRIVAQTLQLDGIIKADGEGRFCCSVGGGSGGGIRIDVGTLSGSGQITANGGLSPDVGGGGGGGRIAVYYQNLTGFDINKITAFGGGPGGPGPHGGAGTVYLQGPNRESGELVVDNNNLTASPTSLLPSSSGQLSFTNLLVREGKLRVDDSLTLAGALTVSSTGELTLKSSLVASSITLNTNSTLLSLAATGSAFFKLDLSANTIAVDATSRIDVTGRGFLGGNRAGNPFGESGMTVGFQRGSTGRSGASYAGLGGNFEGSSNPVYGDFRNPNEPGSGGAERFNQVGNNGGGLVRIVAQTLQLDGIIKADGEGRPCCSVGGGSGGGIRIDVGTLSGSGQITANGGLSPDVGGGGGGGRIAVYYQDVTDFDLSKITAFGGGPGGPGPHGGAGSVYLQGPGRESGELILDNNNRIPPNETTPIFTVPSGPLNLTDLRVRRGAKARAEGLLNVQNGIEISTDSRLIALNRVLADTIRLVTRSTFDLMEEISAVSLEIADTSVLAHVPTTGSVLGKLILNTDTITIDASSRIDVTGRGFLGGNRPGNPFGESGMTIGFQRGSTGRSGGGYGGLGGVLEGVSNPVYGDFLNPNEPGSGGAERFNQVGNNGGGLVRIAAQTLQLDGIIKADGEGRACCSVGGGSGGGIRIDVGTLSGAGQITANGGIGPDVGGGGGGGRIAIHYQSFVGFDITKVTVLGRAGNGGGTNGQNGTIHLQQQVALLPPALEEAPLMKAETVPDSLRRESIGSTDSFESTGAASARSMVPDIKALLAEIKAEVAIADRPQQRIFSASVFETRDFKLETLTENRVASLLPSVSSLTPADDFDPIYTYDLNGNRISMIDPTGLTTYTYDALNRLTSMTNNKGQTTAFTYDALGRRTSMTHANGVVTSYIYDAASQLIRLAHQLGAATINSFDYTYDKVGNRKSKVDSNGPYNYAYDSLNRLIEALNPLPSNPMESYVYDPVGNRTNSNQNGLSVFNSANQLSEDAGFTYQYDANGNQTRKTAKTGGAFTIYEYDAENKLTRVVKNGTTVNYRYDGLGRRAEKEVIDVGTTTSRYVYDNEDILLELDGANNLQARYTHGPGIDEPLIMEKNSQSFFYHSDGLGSITELTNQAGAVVQHYAYSSFGKIESQLDPNFVQPYTFTAREFDPEATLHFYRARTY
ncbi:MAG: hypothetical protein ACREX3_08045, partial [Gammaproteobacteria bacterium]